ncbi:MAG: VWA domain-containing protein [Bacteroides sp.]|nr:VWA domain-containing protein [Bacteroides sp.]
MKKALILCFNLLLVANLLFSQSAPTAAKLKDLKSTFNFKEEGNYPHLKSYEVDGSKKMLRNQVWEYSLMENGYFTIGTNNGTSAGKIDDKCSLTYGHPYSMTSFPYPVINGMPIYPYDLPLNTIEELRALGDTLLLEYTLNPQVQVSTLIFADQNGELTFEFEVYNGDVSAHQLGMGLLFDADLGRWGDGYVELGGEIVKSVHSLTGNLTDSLLIWEREAMPKGLGLHLGFDSLKPDELVLGNWFNEYYNDTIQSQLYDLAIHAKWNEIEVSPGESVGFSMKCSLPVPELTEQAFIRWDMPSALSIENQLLFPSQLISNVEIIHDSDMAGEYTLRIVESENVYGWESDEPFSLASSDGFSYQNATVRIPEIYDSIVIPMTLQLLKSGQILDELSRNIFIPAAPFSDEGLEVVIDTAYVTNSRVNISFYTFKSETEQVLYNLHKNNVFLYDNNNFVEDFRLEKDTAGGTNNSDIIFVLDVTGSMTDEIAGVRDNIIEFTDSLSFRGVDFRLGMVTFLDVIENVYDFTRDVQEFQMNVSVQYAHGGGDRAENSLDALAAASLFDFRENANRIIIWITDADYHVGNDISQETKESVVDQLLIAGIQVHCIGNPDFQTDYYDQITLNTGGNYFDINGNFRDILLEVSRLNQATNHLLSFNRSEPVNAGDDFKIEVHYAGLGGYDIVSLGNYAKSITAIDHTRVHFYPNPLDQNSTIVISGSGTNHYEIQLYNVNGQLLQSKVISGNSGTTTVALTDFINLSALNRDQVYLLKISTLSPGGVLLQYETLKIGKF